MAKLAEIIYEKRDWKLKVAKIPATEVRRLRGQRCLGMYFRKLASAAQIKQMLIESNERGFISYYGLTWDLFAKDMHGWAQLTEALDTDKVFILSFRQFFKPSGLAPSIIFWEATGNSDLRMYKEGKEKL